MLLGVNSIAVWGIAADAPKASLIGLLLVAIGTSFAAERVLPYTVEWNRPKRDRTRDLLHAVVNETANFSTLLLLPLLTTALARPGAWPSAWPFPVQLLLAVVVLDLGITLAHFASHRLTWLWRFHAVHHSVKRMYGFNGLMKHPVHQAIETASGTAPLVLLGLPSDVALALVFVVAVQLLLQHSNVDYWVGPLRYVLALNVLHRFHHLKDPAKGDVNFGLFTTLGDHLLRTFHYQARERFGSDELGIGSEPDYPVSYLAQLKEPFRQKAVDSALPSR